MSAIVGRSAILIGLLSSIFGIAANIRAAQSNSARLRRIANLYSVMIVAAAVVAFIAMEIALLRNDFTIAYVAENSAIATPLLFKIATLWSALEGSILLWILVLGLLIGAITWQFRRNSHDQLVRYAIAVCMGVSTFFFALVAGPARPFALTEGPIPSDGPGPNPLLQNHALMAVHPPLLYLGYVGFTIPFAFAIASLITGRMGEGWLLTTRRWTLLAWGSLSVGIILGAWWSYEVLGWGGFWGWDPVENASLIPWLTATAFIHSVLVQERRGMLRVWNLSLICATFCLTILGTFLTRSGVLDSVHAFSAGNVGGWILYFFAFCSLGSVCLIAWRGDQLRSPGSIDSPVSREGAFLVNNLLFASFAFTILLGTTFPLLVEAFNSDRLTIGRPYFDNMTIPAALVLLFLMAVAPVLPWRKASNGVLRDRLMWPAAFGVTTLFACLAVGLRGFSPLCALALGAFAAGSAIRQLLIATKNHRMRGLVGRANGGMVVHLGIILIAVAAACAGSFATRAELRLGVGETGYVNGTAITYRGTTRAVDGRKTSEKLNVQIGSSPQDTYAPALQQYRASQMVVAVPSVKTGPLKDIYLTVVQPERVSDNTAVVGVLVQPMQVWMWVGGGLVGIGSMLAAFPGKRRNPTTPSTQVIDLRADYSCDTTQSETAQTNTSESETAQTNPSLIGKSKIDIAQANSPMLGISEEYSSVESASKSKVSEDV